MSVVMLISDSERLRRDAVIGRILEDVRAGRTIYLPDFDRGVSRPSDEYAMLSVGIEANDYGGTVGEFRYQFEGEEDLLHLMVVRGDGEEVSPEEAQRVVDFLYPGVPVAMMWFKAGTMSHHFYLGHDVLLEYLD
ncbi:hypothetical protein C0431_08615 [bacterium]|nr:hypothetical protein [bacterium]